MSLEEVKQFYFRLKEQVFKGKGILGLFGFGCDSKKLEELLKEVFGTEMRMTDKQHPKYVFFLCYTLTLVMYVRQCIQYSVLYHENTYIVTHTIIQDSFPFIFAGFL